jgi:hypothetical protein
MFDGQTPGFGWAAGRLALTSGVPPGGVRTVAQ